MEFYFEAPEGQKLAINLENREYCTGDDIKGIHQFIWLDSETDLKIIMAEIELAGLTYGTRWASGYITEDEAKDNPLCREPRPIMQNGIRNMNAEELRAFIAKSSKDELKLLLDTMGLHELWALYSTLQKALTTTYRKCSRMERETGGKLAKLRETLTEREYKTLLRELDIQPQDAQNMIYSFEAHEGRRKRGKE